MAAQLLMVNPQDLVEIIAEILDSADLLSRM